MMRIIIPTKGRVYNQLTLANLPDDLKRRTTLVCPSNEHQRLSRNHPLCKVVQQPSDTMGISEKRAWIVANTGYDKIVMLDDDLRFAVRRDDNRAKFRTALTPDILTAFAELEEILSPEVPHAGFTARGGSIGASAQKGGWQQGKRMMYVLGYHIPTVRAHAVFGRLSTHEDMDVCLQLLTKGLPNLVNYDFVVDQKFGNPGGCTNERTIQQNNADSLALAQLFPQFVRTTEKEYSASVPRIEVVCQWMKALEYGFTTIHGK